MLRLITDFDGPIMDVSDRYYRVYQQCLAETQRQGQAVGELPKAEFWDMKRARVPETEIGILSGLDAAQAAEFAEKRRQTVHTLPFLIYDKPAQGAVETLEKVQRAEIDLAVMTMRRVRELDEAFNRCNLGQFFPENRRYCLPNDYVKTGDVKDKPLLMARALAELPPASELWMVGDTDADIIAAKTHGVKVIGVLCGIRDRTQLEMHQPDLIANNLSEAVEIILGSH
ncbi:MAG: HAD family hydrolase [Microcoleus sp. PH2017_10_PVI_O_A]|uniref:HAD family hydrolase n=1 Tax=unclassified Microcoleus TaxID=2642155 RepID=UPI001D5157AA|nr:MULTISPECIES: HAD family hydrolase [unclassified Microcoleus]TAE76424.1 MAG: HAD family hydrolase [Oscillatoriales cyanobacterium]MCC3409327.1 HAD family hydrolase [Microcoleus sp. PH2017_10_PVI_O_A]MCC3463564.1 HAD family hydrolase [Microcoleus sp. PH2017_11_PCY_U_A]MCC3481898.1 HAD family hydrolase [Microcoleus sp. PH2017_12_PCY_D_A]MCC3562873.1 HAD family hydrolase [Microcoleus sp. PH2017_27_LUM_O_A]